LHELEGIALLLLLRAGMGLSIWPNFAWQCSSCAGEELQRSK